LALGFDAEVSVGFLEHDFDLPATDEPGEDVARMSTQTQNFQTSGCAIRIPANDMEAQRTLIASLFAIAA